MVEDLDIKREIKRTEKKNSLKMFPTLFGGGLGKLNDSFNKEQIRWSQEQNLMRAGITRCRERTSTEGDSQHVRCWNTQEAALVR